MTNFWEDLKKNITEWSIVASEIAEEFTHAIKLRIDFIQLERKLSSLYVKLGLYVFSKTKDKNTYMANDPHRKVAVPSLRYMAHLIAPGWNVLGGGEPEIPGISIGHNEYGAWGLTVFRTDGEDLYQYKLNPKDPSEYWYKGKWLKFKVSEEEIPVKGESPKKIELNYSIHGPVTYINEEKSVAFGVRCAWLEIGGSPYLASLRMDQAKTWEEFREACNYSNIPGENMIWADKNGNIGWQSVGIAPIRRNFSGLVPVPGDGSYEWDGYLPIIEKPHVKNPANGFFATANQNVIPKDYKKWDAIGFSWSDPYRGERVNQVLSENDSLTMKDMTDLQVDVTSLPAKKLIPYLDNIDLNVGVGTDVSGIITSIHVSTPGIGYTSGDTFTVVGSGVTGSLTITPNGSIIGAQLPTDNNLEYDIRPLIVLNTTDGFSGKLTPIMKYNAQLITDQDGSTGVRPLVGITSVIDCPPDEHFK